MLFGVKEEDARQNPGWVPWNSPWQRHGRELSEEVQPRLWGCYPTEVLSQPCRIVRNLATPQTG